MERIPCSQELTNHLKSIESSIIFQFSLEDRKHECLRHGDVDACYAMNTLYDGLKYMELAKAKSGQKLTVCLATPLL